MGWKINEIWSYQYRLVLYNVRENRASIISKLNDDKFKVKYFSCLNFEFIGVMFDIFRGKNIKIQIFRCYQKKFQLGVFYGNGQSFQIRFYGHKIPPKFLKTLCKFRM